jgi:V8-like Glu-specific endopeptidase
MARWNRLRRERQNGTITPADYTVALNELTRSVREFVRDVERDLERTLEPVGPPPARFTMPDAGGDAREKLMGAVSQLRSLAWVRRSLEVSRSVCRVLLADGSRGTGFLIDSRRVVTNHHVLPDAATAAGAAFELNYEENLDGTMLPVMRYKSVAGTWKASEDLDCAMVELADDPASPVQSWGALQFAPADPKVGDHVIIVQHPQGGPKQIAVTDNRIINIFEHRLQYTTDTLPGSSGSPVFDDRWRVVAIHHAGGDLAKNSRGERVYANEGILARYVREALGV